MQRSGQHVRATVTDADTDEMPHPPKGSKEEVSGSGRNWAINAATAVQASALAPTPGPWQGKLRRIFFTATFLLLLVGYMHHIWSQHKGQYVSPPVYGLVIDAGSSGSRIHVFQYSDGGDRVPLVHLPSETLKIRPGLSSFADNPGTAGDSLKRLLQFALAHVPAAARDTTPIFLLATAGLRLLADDTADRILESCRDVLDDSPFQFQREWARVLSGRDEGLWGWAAANYAAGGLRPASGKKGRKREMVGVLEMGGASAQVTFQPRADGPPIPPEARTPFQLGGGGGAGGGGDLYTHSFLGFGQEAAQAAAAEAAGSIAGGDPCTPRGAPAPGGGERAVPGAGDFAGCYDVARGLLRRGGDEGECRHPGGCSVAGEPLMPLAGRFVATENFYYTSEFFRLGPRATLQDFRAAGERYCGQEWGALHAAHGGERSEQELLKYCFSAAYIVAFLHEGFRVGMQDPAVEFTNTIQGVAVDWALGALLAEVAAVAPPPKGARVPAPGDLTLDGRWRAGVAAFAALSVLTALQPRILLWWRRRCKQLVPVFDLETGGVIYDDRTQ